LSFSEAVFQISEAVADQRRNLLPQRHLRINRRELKQVYQKHKPKKRDVPAPEPFGPQERFEDFVVVVVRPPGSRDLAEATPLTLI